MCYTVLKASLRIALFSDPLLAIPWVCGGGGGIVSPSLPSQPLYPTNYQVVNISLGGSTAPLTIHISLSSDNANLRYFPLELLDFFAILRVYRY